MWSHPVSWKAMDCGVVRIRSQASLTAAVVKSVPSWNFTPLRNVRSATFGSDVSHFVARPGSSVAVAASRTTASKIGRK